MAENKQTQPNSPTPNPTPSIPNSEQRRDEHEQLVSMVDNWQQMGNQLATPMEAPTENIRINPLDFSEQIDQDRAEQNLIFESTKAYIDSTFVNASTGLNLNSVASLGSQIKMQYDVLIPEQQKLEQEQNHYMYINDQMEKTRQMQKQAFRMQQDQAIMQVQQLTDKLNLDLQTSRTNMQNQIISMLNTYNNLQGSMNQLVLSQKAVEEQQKVLERQKENQPHWYDAFTNPSFYISLGMSMWGGAKLAKMGLGRVGARQASQVAASGGALELTAAGRAIQNPTFNKSIGALLGGTMMALGTFL